MILGDVPQPILILLSQLRFLFRVSPPFALGLGLGLGLSLGLGLVGLRSNILCLLVYLSSISTIFSRRFS